MYLIVCKVENALNSQFGHAMEVNSNWPHSVTVHIMFCFLWFGCTYRVMYSHVHVYLIPFSNLCLHVHRTLYSLRSHERPPGKFEKVVATRAGRLQE